MRLKKCPKCKQIKLLNQFYKNKRYKDGYEYWCIECVLFYNNRNRTINLPRHLLQ